MSWSRSPIGEHVNRVISWNPAVSGSNETFKYVDLGSVNKDSKKVDMDSVPSVVPMHAPSRARQIVQENDVLVATVRPNLNGVAIVPSCLDGATASTGYCVLRANGTSLNSRYLFYWVQSVDFVREMTSKATGANYPAVSDRLVKESYIPLPSPEEQKHIVGVLDKADAIRNKRKQAIELADEFLRSVFLDMFGDPVTNSRGWDVTPLSKAAPVSPVRVLESNSGKDVWLLNLDKVESHSGRVIGKEYVPRSELGSSTVGFDKSHILYSKLRPYLNKVVIPDDIGAATSELLPLKPNTDLLLREYLAYLLRSHSFVRWASEKVAGAKMPRLSMNELRQFEIPLPPRAMQEKFCEISSKVEDVRTHNALFDRDELFLSVCQKVFSGGL